MVRVLGRFISETGWVLGAGFVAADGDAFVPVGSCFECGEPDVDGGLAETGVVRDVESRT